MSDTARLFGTNGVRGVINEDMTIDLVLQLGKSIGKHFSTVAPEGSDVSVALATDTRVSGDMIKSAVSSGLMATGCRVLDLGIVPTPAIQFYVKTHDDVVGGVMITASHNPPQFNGIKCIDGDGTEMARENEMTIEGYYETQIPCNPWNAIGSLEQVTGAGEAYVEAVIAHVDAAEIRKAGLTAVVDCANGAAYQTTPLLLKKLGVRAVTLNANAQGEFPGHPSEPTEDHLRDMLRLTKDVGADLGIAHDGDADRAVFATAEGNFVSGDKSLTLIAKTMVNAHPGCTVVTPVSSSSMVEEVVKENGGDLIYTAVGSPIVARRMMAEGAPFGGEENGGLIFADHQYCRDGAMTIARMLECIVRFGPLQEQIDALPKFYVDKRKIECPNNRKNDLITNMTEVFSSRGQADTTDGLKVTFPDGGWVLMRPSGTEPIFRIYSESKDPALAESRGAEAEKVAQEIMERIRGSQPS